MNEIVRLSPQAVEIEEAVLGASLLEKDAFNVIKDILKPDSFYNEKHSRIYTAMNTLFNRSEPIDILTVTQELKRTSQLEIIGGAYYVSSLTNRIASSANIEFHARIVAQKYLLREIIRICSNSINKAYNPNSDAFDIKELIEKSFVELSNYATSQKQFDTILNAGDEYIQSVYNAMTGKTPASIKMLIPELDEFNLLLKSSLITLAARPGMGKTSMIITLIRNITIVQNIPTGVFSLEMSTNQIFNKIASAECQIDSELITQGKITQKQFEAINTRMVELKNAPLYIDQTSKIDIKELCSRARMMVIKYGIKILFIDYLGLITTKEYRGDKTNSTGYISNCLKALAKELDIPVVNLCQLSRKIEDRPLWQRFPNLSDLRDTGEVEQDSDAVVFLFRPQYYHKDCERVDIRNDKGEVVKSRYFFNPNPKDDNSRSFDVTDKCYVTIEKNRHGRLGVELLGFLSEFTEFYSLQEQKFEPNELQTNNNFLTD